MTDLRTAAQQALDALNLVSDEGESKFPATIQGAISDLEAALAQQAEPVEPVAVFDARWGQPVLLSGAPLLEDEQPLYTAPPQRKPLTEEEIRRLWYDNGAGIELSRFSSIARAIERAHGIGEEK